MLTSKRLRKLAGMAFAGAFVASSASAARLDFEGYPLGSTPKDPQTASHMGIPVGVTAFGAPTHNVSIIAHENASDAIEKSCSKKTRIEIENSTYGGEPHSKEIKRNWASVINDTVRQISFQESGSAGEGRIDIELKYPIKVIDGDQPFIAIQDKDGKLTFYDIHDYITTADDVISAHEGSALYAALKTAKASGATLNIVAYSAEQEREYPNVDTVKFSEQDEQALATLSDCLTNLVGTLKVKEPDEKISIDLSYDPHKIIASQPNAAACYQMGATAKSMKAHWLNTTGFMPGDQNHFFITMDHENSAMYINMPGVATFKIADTNGDGILEAHGRVSIAANTNIPGVTMSEEGCTNFAPITNLCVYVTPNPDGTVNLSLRECTPEDILLAALSETESGIAVIDPNGKTPIGFPVPPRTPTTVNPPVVTPPTVIPPIIVRPPETPEEPEEPEPPIEECIAFPENPDCEIDTETPPETHEEQEQPAPIPLPPALWPMIAALGALKFVSKKSPSATPRDLGLAA